MPGSSSSARTSRWRRSGLTLAPPPSPTSRTRRWSPPPDGQRAASAAPASTATTRSPVPRRSSPWRTAPATPARGADEGSFYRRDTANPPLQDGGPRDRAEVARDRPARDGNLRRGLGSGRGLAQHRG